MSQPVCIAFECLAHVFKDKIRTAWCTFSATFLVVTQTQNMMNVILPKNRRYQGLDHFCKAGLNPQISTKPQSLFWSLLIKGGSQWLHSPFKAMGWFKTVAIRPSSVWVQQPLWNAGRQTYYNTREADEQSHRKLWLWTKTAEHTLECLCRTQQQMIQVGNTRVRSEGCSKNENCPGRSALLPEGCIYLLFLEQPPGRSALLPERSALFPEFFFQIFFNFPTKWLPISPNSAGCEPN